MRARLAAKTSDSGSTWVASTLTTNLTAAFLFARAIVPKMVARGSGHLVTIGSISDYIGRRQTYMIFFVVGAGLYSIVPTTGRMGALVPFVLSYVAIMSMYGGGFATIPAYLRDMFGTVQVGAIHGRLLTAWSTAGVLGPVLEWIGRNKDVQIMIWDGLPVLFGVLATAKVLLALWVARRLWRSGLLQQRTLVAGAALWCAVLDVVRNSVQHAPDARSGQGQRCNGDDRDQRDDQRILDEPLS